MRELAEQLFVAVCVQLCQPDAERPMPAQMPFKLQLWVLDVAVTGEVPPTWVALQLVDRLDDLHAAQLDRLLAVLALPVRRGAYALEETDGEIRRRVDAALRAMVKAC